MQKDTKWWYHVKQRSLAEQEQTSMGVRWGRASGQLSPLKSLVWRGAGSLCWSSPVKGTSSWELPTLLWSREHVGARSLFSVNDTNTTRVCQAINSILKLRAWEKVKTTNKTITVRLISLQLSWKLLTKYFDFYVIKNSSFSNLKMCWFPLS